MNIKRVHGQCHVMVRSTLWTMDRVSEVYRVSWPVRFINYVVGYLGISYS